MTRGPWETRGQNAKAHYVVEPSSERLNQVTVALVMKPEDARAIEALPDLLEALEGLLDLVESQGWGERWSNLPEMHASRAAIAKARGEA